jgi:hypothetical protein
MRTDWPCCLAVALGVVLTAGSARADDDKKDGKGKGGDRKEWRDKDDQFEKRYREHQKKYEDQRREAVKRFQEQQREGRKREAEWQKKLEQQYREDQKRQEEWSKKADKENRKQFEEQLKRQMRDAGRRGDSRPEFGPAPVYPPAFPAFGAVPDRDRLPMARRATAAYGPLFARELSGVLAGGRGFDPRAAQMAADLARRSERLAELGRRDADLSALRQEYAAVEGGWQQLTPYLDRAVRDPASRDLAWRLYQTERRLRSAVGYDPAGPDWANVTAVAHDQTVRLGQLVGWARDSRADANLAYDLRNAQREAQAFEDLVARRAPVDQLQEQHASLVAAFARVSGPLQAARPEAPIAEVVQQLFVADGQLRSALGLSVYHDDATRGLIDRTAELQAAADRFRREAWAVLGQFDQEVIDYYVRPADELAASADLVHQMLVEGRPIELVRAGWQRVVDWTGVVGQRVEMLDPTQYAWVRRLSGDVGRRVQEVADRFPPPAGP